MKYPVKALLVLSSVIVALSVLFPPSIKVALGVGHVDVPLDLIFLDDASGQPIDGALIRLQELEMVDELPKEPYSILRQSGPDGHARINLKGLMVTSSDRASNEGRFLSHLSRSVQYPAWECHVTAEGYRGLKVSNHDFRSRYMADRRFHEDSVPPSIMFRLRK